MAWVYKKECPQCHKAKMGKPVVKGKVKIRALLYKCPSCEFTEEKKEHEESLQLDTKYTCPECHKEGGHVLNVGRNHFGVCMEHGVCWNIGSNLFSSWRHQSEEDWQENAEVLERMREVGASHWEYKNYSISELPGVVLLRLKNRIRSIRWSMSRRLTGDLPF